MLGLEVSPWAKNPAIFTYVKNMYVEVTLKNNWGGLGSYFSKLLNWGVTPSSRNLKFIKKLYSGKNPPPPLFGNFFNRN